MPEPAFFFVGNCQAQYLASVVGACTTAPRFFLGRKLAINVAIDGPQATYLNERAFLAKADEVRAAGGDAVLIAQETSKGEFSGLIRTERERFTHHALFPYVHFKSLWPEKTLGKEVEQLSDAAIRRNRDMERMQLKPKLARCGIDPAFAEAYWRKAEDSLLFYCPAHAAGEVFADVLLAMGEPLRRNLPHHRAIIDGLRRSPGIFQNTFHPVHPRVAEVLGLRWAETEMYQAWMGLRVAGDDPEALRVAARRAQAVADSPDLLSVLSPEHQAHFRTRLAFSWIKLGRRGVGLPMLQQAVIDLKGFGPLLQKALRAGARAGRADVIEELLVGVAPFVDFTRNLHAQTYDRTFQTVAASDAGRQALQQTRERLSSELWLKGYLDRVLTQAA